MRTAPANFADMEDAQFDELLRLSRTYHREALRCEKAKAHLAGCVLLGACLEASLVAMVHCFSDEVAASTSAPRIKGALKPLLDWNLGELLRVAKQLAWLPANLDLHEEWNRKRAQIGDYAEAMRQLRNLLHPARYLTDYPRKRVTQRHLTLSFEVMEIAAAHIHNKLVHSIAARSLRTGTGARPKTTERPV
jgi:hypothetical protein